MLKIVMFVADNQPHVAGRARWRRSVRDRDDELYPDLRPPTSSMSIVPIHRRAANVEPGERVSTGSHSAVPERVPILMRMPDLARIDEPQTTLSLHAPSDRASEERPPQSRRTAARPASTRPSRPVSPPKHHDVFESDRDCDSDSDRDGESDMSSLGPVKIRVEDPRRRSRPRRDRPSSRSQSPAASWFCPTNLMVGAAVLAVIISIVAMVRRPATQPIDAGPPGWNAEGGNPPAVNPAPPAPLEPTAVAQPEQPDPTLPGTPVPAAAPMGAGDRGRRRGAWSSSTQVPPQAPPESSTSAPQLQLPEPDPEPGQWPTRSAMRPPRHAPLPPEMTPPFPSSAGANQTGEPSGTATLTGTIDKPEPPTTRRAEHERTGQGVY